MCVPVYDLCMVSNHEKKWREGKRERERGREGEKKKTRGTKRERAESFRFVERIASLFSIGRKCRIEVEFRLKRFYGMESCLADFYISRSPLVARVTGDRYFESVCTICRRVKRY